jgi:hypothetical protein
MKIAKARGILAVWRLKVEIEVVVDDVSEEDVVLVKKNHKLMIHLNKKQIGDNVGDTLK